MTEKRWGLTIPLMGEPLHRQRDVIESLPDLGYTDVWSSEADGADGFTPLAVSSVWAPELRLGIAVAAHWYDVSVRVGGQPDFLRRFAGHIETGAPSVSDPAMEGLAKADQYRVQGT